jgi:hypothetical protein
MNFLEDQSNAWPLHSLIHVTPFRHRNSSSKGLENTPSEVIGVHFTDDDYNCTRIMRSIVGIVAEMRVVD